MNMIIRILPIPVLLLVIFLSSTNVCATHLRAGEIIAERKNCFSLTFSITITVYIDTKSGVQFGGPGEYLKFGDGSQIEVPLTSTNIRTDLGNEMGTASYTIFHTYGGPGHYAITYEEANRNENIVNISNSVETRFFLVSSITIDPFLGCSNTPQLLIPPIDKSCTGSAWLHNPGAFDPDGDSLSYELTVPKKGYGLLVDNYRDPNAREFYDRIGMDYLTANEEKDGTPMFFIDPINGTLTWNAPGASGEYNIAFIVKEWRKFNGLWINIGFVIRDMQIIVEDCKNERPRLLQPADICVVAGEEITIEVNADDGDSDELKIEAFSQIFSIQPSAASFLPDPVVYQPSPGKLRFTWKTDCEHVKDQPYMVVFKVTDKPDLGVPLVDFKTWHIKVVGPAPIWENVTTNLGNRSTLLTWQSYRCTNASSIQVWRRVNHFNFTPSPCLTGIPDYLGYSKIAEVPSSSTGFNDTNSGRGLAVGAAYCYRLVAVYPQPGGGESYVSAEICIPPIQADAPVVTHVSVDKTHPTEGGITVRWRSPFEANEKEFPKPYSYEVFRAENFIGIEHLKRIHPGKIRDSVYVDTGINTEVLPYHYRIAVYDANGIRIDTSKTASSIRLQTVPSEKEISLAWSAHVPWSNQSERYPNHLIYRGPEGASADQLILVDSVNVNVNGMSYVDRGNYRNTPLLENEKYCYRVISRGVYGNPKIREPLINSSQVSCATIGVQTKPCSPILETVGIDCSIYDRTTSCVSNVFSNTIKWFKPTNENCLKTARSYNVYASDREGGFYSMIADNLRDTFYIHTNLYSHAQCYRISAVDQNGNESILSDEFCFDNCPRYELPNVFTPDGDNCNDYFSAWGNTEHATCGEQDKFKCARFVDKVVFIVYNRWGEEVYQYHSGKEKSIYINWNGHDSQGHQLTGGIYYYKATVYFITSHPDKEKQEIKGWVHLIRSN